MVALARLLCKNGRAREIRLGAALSMREIANSLGVTLITVWRWEHGTTPREAVAERYVVLLAGLLRLQRDASLAVAEPQSEVADGG